MAFCFSSDLATAFVAEAIERRKNTWNCQNHTFAQRRGDLIYVERNRCQSVQVIKHYRTGFEWIGPPLAKVCTFRIDFDRIF